jgi:hypothetical protein
MKSGSNRESATAALLLGELLNKQRDFPGAERALEAAVESGQPDIVPVAAFGLGWLRTTPATSTGHSPHSTSHWNRAISDLREMPPTRLEICSGSGAIAAAHEPHMRRRWLSNSTLWLRRGAESASRSSTTRRAGTSTQ